MRNYLLAAVATAVIASPAIARDGQPYIGIEGGLLFPKDQDGDILVDFTTTQTPLLPAAPAGPIDFEADNALGIDYKRGRDLDLIAGYDFGFFRIEGEVAFKRARLDQFEVDNDFIADLNDGLNLPSATPDTGAPGDPALLASDFDLDGTVKVRSTSVMTTACPSTPASASAAPASRCSASATAAGPVSSLPVCAMRSATISTSA